LTISFHKDTIKGFTFSPILNINRIISIPQWYNKRDVIADYLKLTKRFQFHNGTIKGECHREVLRLVHEFQFHHGTIKAPDLTWIKTML